MNQLAAPPSFAPLSTAPITADPPKIVATRLPATAFADAPLRATKKSGMSFTRRALRTAITIKSTKYIIKAIFMFSVMPATAGISIL